MRRLRTCVENWPECEEGSYDPACCRFPKSCSCTVYDPAAVKESDLEPSQEAKEIMTHHGTCPRCQAAAEKLPAGSAGMFVGGIRNMQCPECGLLFSEAEQDPKTLPEEPLAADRL